MSIEMDISEHLAKAVELRHRLHQIPELAFTEFQTAAMIRAELEWLEIPHIDGVLDAPTATICMLGNPQKPCIALRADIDALPIIEQTGHAYSSRHEGRMHACGHDGHSSILFGVAGILKSIANELPVCVKLIWQPAEEEGGGAEKLVTAGVLDGTIGPKVSAVFGLHGWPGLPVGLVSTKPGPLLAAVDTFKLTVTGKGCHGAFPHAGRDPIVAACEIVLNLQQCVSRDLDPTEPGVVTIGIIRGGSATNVIPDQVILEGTIRTLNEKTREMLKASVERRAAGVAAAGGCVTEIQWQAGYPALINDPAMTDYVTRIARQTLGAERFFPAARPAMGGEDFAYYLEKVPGCFFLVGVQPPGTQVYPPLHSDRYDFTDAAMAIGIRMFVELVLNFGN